MLLCPVRLRDRYGVCEQALLAAGLPVTVFQPMAMQAAAGLLLDSEDTEAALTADMCEQAIIRVKAYMAKEAARKSRETARATVVNAALHAAGVFWTVQTAPWSVKAILEAVTQNPDPHYEVTDEITAELISKVRSAPVLQYASHGHRGCRCGNTAAQDCIGGLCGACCVDRACSRHR